jgi:Zinc carboxypeptidase
LPDKPHNSIRALAAVTACFVLCVGIGIWLMVRWLAAGQEAAVIHPPVSQSPGAPTIAPPANVPVLPLHPTAHGGLPPLEYARQAADTTVPAGNIHIDTTGLDCAVSFDSVKAISPTHFVIQTNATDFFMFHVTGALHKTVRIDIHNPNSPLIKWRTLNPVYYDGWDFDNPATYVSPAGDIAARTTSWAGSILDDTTGQHWHFVPNAWMADNNTFCFVHTFTDNGVTVASRVPYMPGYAVNFYNQLKNPLVSVDTVGQSAENRPLLLIKVSSGDEAAEKTKPCIVFYAGEASDHHDGMWVTQGVVEYLLNGSPAARRLLDHYTFLIVPMINPDATADGDHFYEFGYRQGRTSPGSFAYANCFENWMNAGKPINLVFDLMSAQSYEIRQVHCPVLPPDTQRGQWSQALHRLVLKNCLAEEYTCNPAIRLRGSNTGRLAGWLDESFGTLDMVYQINSQEKTRHLNLAELKHIGAVLAQSADEFLTGPFKQGLMQQQTGILTHRKTLLSKLDATKPQNAIEFEAELQAAGHSAAP